MAMTTEEDANREANLDIVGKNTNDIARANLGNLTENITENIITTNLDTDAKKNNTTSQTSDILYEDKQKEANSDEQTKSEANIKEARREANLDIVENKINDIAKAKLENIIENITENIIITHLEEEQHDEPNFGHYL
jgi:hypothetical protein